MMEFKIVSKYNIGDKVYYWNKSRGAMAMGTIKSGSLQGTGIWYKIVTGISKFLQEETSLKEEELFSDKKECAKYYDIDVPEEVLGEKPLLGDAIDFLLACKRTLYHFNNPLGICPSCGEYILLEGLVCPGCGYDSSIGNG